MKVPSINYDKKSDALYLVLKKGPEEDYKEVAPGVGVELGKKGEVLGIEILRASKVLGNLLKGKNANRKVSHVLMTK